MELALQSSHNRYLKNAPKKIHLSFFLFLKSTVSNKELLPPTSYFGEASYHYFMQGLTSKFKVNTCCPRTPHFSFGENHYNLNITSMLFICKIASIYSTEFFEYQCTACSIKSVTCSVNLLYYYI